MMKVIIVLLAVLIASTHESDVPRLLQRINRALGLPEQSKVLWDILTIANNTNEITDLKERVDQLEECCSCTKKQVLLVATGSWTNQSQVIDLNSPTNCSNLQPFPHALAHGAGGVLNGHPVICGGSDSLSSGQGYEIQSSCYMHDHSQNEWTLFGHLNTARMFHASALLNGDLWMTGGYNRYKTNIDSVMLASTELVSQDETISEGTPLPVARASHCMVTLHDGRVMILGGQPYSVVSKNVLIFDASDNAFTNGTELLYSLVDGACTIFRSAMHENRPVVFAGGSYGKPLENKAQLLDYTLGNTWEEISDLPTSSSLWGAVALPTLTGDGVIVQHGPSFYQLNCNASSCNWEILEKELSLSVTGAVAMILPAEYTCE